MVQRRGSGGGGAGAARRPRGPETDTEDRAWAVVRRLHLRDGLARGVRTLDAGVNRTQRMGSSGIPHGGRSDA